MWRCRLTELNWVSTKIRFSPEWMQFEMGMSIRRYLPAIGTAGLLRDLVSGKRRVPRPPPRIRLMTLGIETLPTIRPDALRGTAALRGRGDEDPTPAHDLGRAGGIGPSPAGGRLLGHDLPLKGVGEVPG